MDIFFMKNLELINSREIQNDTEEIVNWVDGLENIADRIQRHFASLPTFKRAVQYLKGLLGESERKNGWQLSESTGDSTPYGIQNLMSRANWNADAVRDDLQSYVIEHFSEQDGILVVDETGFLKKGNKSAGVQRQYSGTAGRIENCQIGVFLGYATEKGHTLIDRELYLPESWTKDKNRCQEAGSPEGITFQTKPQLARKMIEKAFANGVPFKWITGDEVYGNNGKLRQWLESDQHQYVMAVSSDTCICKGFEQLRVSEVEKRQKDWNRLSAGEGSKGHRWYDWAKVQINSMEGKRYVLFRRNIEKPSEIAYYLVFSPHKVSLEEMVHVAGKRWTIESCFESAKNEVGLDEYEVRKWQGWYHHITLVLFAHAFLRVICKNSNRECVKKGGTAIPAMKEFKRHRGIFSH